MNQPSLRRTLLVRCGLGVGVLLCLLSCGVYLIVRHGLYRELDRSIIQTAALLSNQVELENETITFEWQEGIGTNRGLRDEGLFQFWNEATGETTRSARLRGKDLPKFHSAGGAPQLKNILMPGSGREVRAIGMRIYPFVTPEESERMKSSGRIIDPKSMPHILVVARDTKSIYRVLNRARLVLAAGTLLTLGLGFLLIDRVVRVALRPIDELTRQMRDRAGHQLDSALDLPGQLPTELTGLAETFDSLLARVAAIRQRESDFIRHAVHELRTPIAGLRATTDLALSQPRNASAYDGYLATCQKTAIDLGELVKRLSALSRIGQSVSLPARKPLDTGALLGDCLGPFLPLFTERGVVVETVLPEKTLVAMADPTLTRIIFNNLLDNAVCYSAPGTAVRINGCENAGKIEIRIANPAEDLPPQLDRLFEPLFRRDLSRADSGVHLGIGLTLSQEAASAMGATLLARKTNEGWIEFLLLMNSENPAA